MGTFLLTWNPDKWNWDDIDECIKILHRDGQFDDGWSCGRTKKIESGDRICIMRQGREPRGIFASGYATSKPF